MLKEKKHPAVFRQVETAKSLHWQSFVQVRLRSTVLTRGREGGGGKVRNEFTTTLHFNFERTFALWSHLRDTALNSSVLGQTIRCLLTFYTTLKEQFRLDNGKNMFAVGEKILTLQRGVVKVRGAS